jgi:hypothetical protein
MLTGRTPFKADTPTATIHQILHDDPSPPQSITKNVDLHLASLALRLMAKQPEDRFASAVEAATALDAKTGVSSPERRRRTRRRMALGLFVLALVTCGLWIFSRFGGQSEIAHVWVVDRGDPRYEQLKTSVLVRYGDDPTARVFREFPREVEQVIAVALIDLDQNGAQAVIVGLAMPHEGCNVFIFDARGNELWRLDISNHPSVERWPDCGFSAQWSCKDLAAGNLDGVPGDELVVVMTDRNDYPTRVSVVDPRTGTTGPTFWHMGQLGDILVLPDFFGPGRPALVVRGQSNKLDGFGQPPPRPYTPAPGEDRPRTDCDIVAVLMILDPADMDGLGPPRSGRIPGIPAVRPYAYAFMDMPTVGGTYIPPGETQWRTPDPAETANIDDVVPSPGGRRDGEPCLKVITASPPEALRDAILTVDRNLNLLAAEGISGSVMDAENTSRYWRARWRPIVQNREFISE